MKKAVMYGGGNIGRGFLGKVFSDSGYEVTFIDIVPEVIEAMNERGCYDVRIVSNEGTRIEKVTSVRAVDARTQDAVRAIAQADIMATAVGVNAMKIIAKTIAEGLKLRRKEHNSPLDIILAENQLNADVIMRGYIYEYLNDEEKRWADENLGLVEASIGRMVPKMSKEDAAGDPLVIAVEEYCELPVDKEGFKGEIPDLVGLVPFSPFSFYMKRKLFIHNMSHAITAYLGALRGIVTIDEAISVPEIEEKVRSAAKKISLALSREYGVPQNELDDNAQDLVKRFKNKALKETVARVAADPIRKLRIDDRLVGAALYTLQSGQQPTEVVEAIVAALKYSNPDDNSAVLLQDELNQKGVEFVLENRCGLKKGEPLYEMILTEYNGK